MNGGALYGGGNAVPMPDIAGQPVTHTEFLLKQQAHLRAELAKVDAALEALKTNPEVERVMNLVALALHGPMTGRY